MDCYKTPASKEICRAAKPGNGKRFSGKRQHRGRAERDDEVGVHEPQLLVEPPTVVLDLSRRRLLVDAALSPLLEFEMLDGIGDVDSVPVHACFEHRPVEELSGGSHKRSSQPIFLVTGLLADQGDPGTNGTFPRNCLWGALHNRVHFSKESIELVERLCIGKTLRRCLGWFPGHAGLSFFASSPEKRPPSALVRTIDFVGHPIASTIGY